jgi:hypothetical protein
LLIPAFWQTCFIGGTLALAGDTTSDVALKEKYNKVLIDAGDSASHTI